MARRLAMAAAAIAVAGGIAWYIARPEDAGEPIRRRLQAFAGEVNSTVDGRGTDARAAHVGTFFTDDAEVDLGRGAAPIKGRETLVSMAARLQPRLAAFRLRFEDLNVALAPDGQS